MPDSIHLERCCPEPPTEAQLDAMRQHKDFIPDNICKEDASYIISRYMDNDDFAGKTFLDFATSQNVFISYYIGKNALMELLWEHFDIQGKIALYMICVKKNITNRWNFKSFEKYKKISSNLLENEKFMNYFKRVTDGELFPDDINEQRNCYMIVSEFV